MKTKSIAHYSLVIILSFISVFAFSQDKVALIVAIGDYPADGGWMQISSKNDVPLIKNALIAQGFEEQNISIIQDEKATRQAILDAIKTQLVDKASAGGVGFFHYSGHGQQVMDNNSDEIDGYDEAIVPYDSPMRYIEGVYEGENLIRDEEMGELFDQARAKLGPSGNFLTVIDACHSGTGTRGMAKSRGTDFKMAPEGHAATASRGSTESNAMEGVQSVGVAPLVAFFGAAPHQLNFETTDEEGNGVGSLSYAFSKKFSMATKSTSYRMLFDQIKLEMSSTAPRQQPQAEGMLDQEIMGGNAVERINYYSISVNNDPNSIVVKAGWLQGVHEGSKIGIYGAETMAHSDTEPIAIGYVEKSRAMESVVYMEEPLNDENANAYLAIVLEKGFGNIAVNVKMAVEDRDDVSNAMKSKFEKYPIIQISDDAELFVVKNGNKFDLITKDEYVLDSKPASFPPNTLATAFTRKIVSYAQAKFLRDLEVSSYLYPVEFEIVPIDYDKKNMEVLATQPIETKMDAGGNIHFKDGDFMQIKVTNMGDKNAYYTLIDIQPDNVVNILIPDTHEVASDFQLGPGESKTLPKVFEIGPPTGSEVFKLIATDTPIDLRTIVQSRGNATKNASPNPFEKLFMESYFKEDSTSTRGTKVLSLGGTDVNVYSRVFSIDN